MIILIARFLSFGANMRTQNLRNLPTIFFSAFIYEQLIQRINRSRPGGSFRITQQTDGGDETIINLFRHLVVQCPALILDLFGLIF